VSGKLPFWRNVLLIRLFNRKFMRRISAWLKSDDVGFWLLSGQHEASHEVLCLWTLIPVPYSYFKIVIQAMVSDDIPVFFLPAPLPELPVSTVVIFICFIHLFIFKTGKYTKYTGSWYRDYMLRDLWLIPYRYRLPVFFVLNSDKRCVAGSF